MKNNNKIKLLCIVLPTLILSSCATIMSGSTEVIQVQAIDASTQKPISGARCTITDGKSNTYVTSGNPGSVTVSRGNGALQTKCTANGYIQKDVGVGSSFNAWTVVNVLFWPGLIVDGVSGAYAKYPSHITAIMEKS